VLIVATSNPLNGTVSAAGGLSGSGPGTNGVNGASGTVKVAYL